MNTAFLNSIDQSLAEREHAQLLRQLRVHNSQQSKLVNLASNDYLNLSKHPDVIAAAQNAIELFGTSASGSPTVASYLTVHEELESSLCSWLNFNHCLIWNSGYTANKSITKSLMKRSDLVLADRYIHFSMIEGILESKARLIRFTHNDINHLEKLLQKFHKQYLTIFVVMESLYSMDGDSPNFKEFAALKEKYSFIWIVDEAHALGWYGPRGNGLVAENQIQHYVDILIGTFGKALASQGAFSVFHNKKIKDYLINFSKEFIYTTYPSPANTAAANQSIQTISKKLYHEQAFWHKKAQDFCINLQTFFPYLSINNSPIIPIIYPTNTAMLNAHELLRKNGILTGAIRPPSVPEGTSRLRFSIHKDIVPSTLASNILARLAQGIVS